MKTILIKSLTIALILAFYGCDIEKRISKKMDKQFQKNENPDYITGKEEIAVVTVGTGSPLPGKRAQPGTAVLVNGHFFLFDVGPGVVQKCENHGLRLENLDGIFFTHYHSDHYMDLPNLINRSWALGRINELHIYGPDGLNNVVQAANQFIAIDNQYRVDHHGPVIMDISKVNGIPHEFKNVRNSKEIIYEKDGITITAFDVDHEPIEPGVGYTIEYKGKKVIISGDTRKNELLEKMAKDADLLVHEVMLMSYQKLLEESLVKNEQKRRAQIIHDIQDFHTGTEEVALLASNANVKRLVLNHLSPYPDRRAIKRMYLKELQAYKGPVHLADDGDVFIIKTDPY
jgi:ribonuclease Z